MKKIFFFLFITFSFASSAQLIDSISPKKINLKNCDLQFHSSNVMEQYTANNEFHLWLNFSYELNVSKIAVSELDKQISLVVKKLRPAVNYWIEKNKNLPNMKYWQFYTIDLSLHGKDAPYKRFFRYVVNEKLDSVIDKEVTFSLDQYVTKIKILYGTNQLKKITGLDNIQRKNVYQNLVKKIPECATSKVSFISSVSEQLTKEQVDSRIREMKMYHYLECFRELVKNKFRTSDSDILSMLYMEMCLFLGDEDEYFNH